MRIDAHRFTKYCIGASWLYVFCISGGNLFSVVFVRTCWIWRTAGGGRVTGSGGGRGRRATEGRGEHGRPDVTLILGVRRNSKTFAIA